MSGAVRWKLKSAKAAARSLFGYNGVPFSKTQKIRRIFTIGFIPTEQNSRSHLCLNGLKGVLQLQPVNRHGRSQWAM